MSISEAERHEIYELIKSATSDRVANNVMSMLPPVGWADVATKSDLAATKTELHAEIGSLRSELHTEIGAVRSDIEALRSELHTEIGAVRSEFGSLRADMHVLRADVMSEMHQSIRSQTWALVAWTTGLAGLIVALGR
jgi:hypothetical protein